MLTVAEEIGSQISTWRRLHRRKWNGRTDQSTQVLYAVAISRTFAFPTILTGLPEFAHLWQVNLILLIIDRVVEPYLGILFPLKLVQQHLAQHLVEIRLHPLDNLDQSNRLCTS